MTGRNLAGRRVLVVEDEFFIADDLAKALSALGEEVVGPVPAVAEALRVVADERLDLAVLDINLRGVPVFPVADALRAKNVPFVFATGYADTAIPAAYASVPRWEKPYREDDLARALGGTGPAPDD